jgi:xylitol oxidase
MRYGELALALDAEGWALHNMGSLPHIGVAGATATATHGSGDANGNLSTAVRALRYVGADGEVRDVARGHADFPALVVGLGAYGLVTEVTLAIEPSYRVRQDIYAGITWEAALADFDAITTAGYSVSVFTTWGDTVDHVWVKTRLASDDVDVARTLLDGARVADDSPLGSDDNVTPLGGVPGPWMLRLPHFRLDREPSFGAEIQSEYFVDRADAPAALRAVRELAPLIRPHLVVSELRTAARDDLWLSTAYERDVLAIHFTWHDRAAEVAAVIPRIEAALAPFAARPHWGKVHGFDAERIAAVHPRLADARAVFERLDPEGRFVNAHLERVGVRLPR